MHDARMESETGWCQKTVSRQAVISQSPDRVLWAAALGGSRYDR